jgi:hypothetical protein
MKASVAIALIASGMLAAAAPEARHTAWQWEQSVIIPAGGMVRLDLPPPTLDASQPGLGDLRLVSSAGVDTPYLIEIPVPSLTREKRAVDFKAALVEPAPERDAATVLECATATGEPLQAITLETPVREFIKSASVEGSNDGTTWQALASREVIFRQAGGAERLRIQLPSGTWQRLRCTLSDVRSNPVAFTGLRLTLTDSKQPETVTHEVSLQPATESAGSTRITLDLGAANLHLAELKLAITDPVFSRNYALGFITGTTGGGTGIKPLGEGTLYRVLGEQGTSTERLVIPIHLRIPARQLVLTLQNGDSPPLTLSGASASRYPTKLAFHAVQPGTWRLLTGNTKATIPHYDLAPLRDNLTNAGGQRINPGPLQAKADFQVPPALPGVDPAGANIDLTNWTRRSAVQVPGTGVIRIELKPATLAASNNDLGDLRLVQDGRQLPYLIEPATILRGIDCQIAKYPNAKRPQVTRWKVATPMANLPLSDLTASSPAALFTRTFTAAVEEADSMTAVWIRPIAYTTWTKTADTASNKLHINLNGARVQQTLLLETDNGDNPPLELENVSIRYTASFLAAKLVAATPVFLYYGNPQATAPAYDLRLVRDELLAADKQTATLGSEETLNPDRAKPWAISAGSPWLWAALALVVAVLLGVVAKLLPKPQ